MENAPGPFQINSPAPLVGLKRPPRARILIVDDEKTNVEVLSRFLVKQGYEVVRAYNGQEALEKVRASAPDLILLDVMMPVLDGLAVCQKLRADLVTHSLPIILLTARNALEDRIKGLRSGVDDYMAKPFDLQEVVVRLEGVLQRRRWDLGSQPLTHLPGGPGIEEEVWKRLRIGSPFAFAYLDVDNFKAYNDVYGYEGGDRVIKDLASILIDSVKKAPDGCAFAGHIGGDDFVFLSTIDHVKQAVPRIAESFDAERVKYYHAHDLDRGFIQTKDRQGKASRFPLMTLSIAIVSTETRRILHYARLGEIASELKHFIKSQDHHGRSLLWWDRRTDQIARKDGERE